jgi:hypothetical protein
MPNPAETPNPQPNLDMDRVPGELAKRLYGACSNAIRVLWS